MQIAPPAIARLVKDARLQASLERSQIYSGGGMQADIPDRSPGGGVEERATAGLAYRFVELRQLP